MRALIQRVTKASVTINEELISEIENGLLVFVCAMNEDNELQAENLASKIAKLRIFNDENGKMNKSIQDIISHILIYVELFIQFSLQTVLDTTLHKHWFNESNFQRAIDFF